LQSFPYDEEFRLVQRGFQFKNSVGKWMDTQKPRFTWKISIKIVVFVCECISVKKFTCWSFLRQMYASDWSWRDLSVHIVVLQVGLLKV